jgi:hypothetical protein
MWNDTQIRHLTNALLLPVSDTHYFGDIGYQVGGTLICPIGGRAGSTKYQLSCSCDVSYDIDYFNWPYKQHNNAESFHLSLEYLRKLLAL